MSFASAVSDLGIPTRVPRNGVATPQYLSDSRASGI